MRYLKTYKIFEGVNQVEILDDIRDILLELEDAGYFILVNWTPLTLTGSRSKREIFIQISKMNKPIFVKDETELEILSSSLDRLKAYLMSSNYEIKNFFFDNSSYNNLTSKIESGKSFKSIFDKFWSIKKHNDQMFEFGDVGDYIYIGLVEKIEKVKESISEDIREDINDIALDLTDGRFSVMVRWSPMKEKWSIIVGLKDYTDYDGFLFSEVEAFINRVKEYLGSKYYGWDALKVGESIRTSPRYQRRTNTGTNIEDDDRLSNITIYYKI